MLDLDKKILSLRGEEIPKSFPTQKEIDALPKNKNGQPDISKLEKETYGNMILNSLASYVVKDKREGFYINALAQIVMEGGKVNLKEKYKKFLIEVLDEMILRIEKINGKEEQKGIYAAWGVAQILKDLDVKE